MFTDLSCVKSVSFIIWYLGMGASSSCIAVKAICSYIIFQNCIKQCQRDTLSPFTNSVCVKFLNITQKCAAVRERERERVALACLFELID